MVNFTAHYLGILKKDGIFNKITDGTVEVDTIKVLNPGMFQYFRPRIVYDKFINDERYVEPQISNISFNDMKRMGFTIISIKTSKKNPGWFKYQNVIYRLIKETALIGNRESLLSLPPKHHIEFDSANKMVRLVGKNAGGSGFGRWMRT